jgi:hypothetical protein
MPRIDFTCFDDDPDWMYAWGLEWRVNYPNPARLWFIEIKMKSLVLESSLNQCWWTIMCEVPEHQDDLLSSL